MLPAKVKMTIQILTIMLKVHIFLSQIDIEVSKFLLDRSSSNNFLISKMVLTLNNGSSNSVRTAQQPFLKIIQMKVVI